MKKTIRAFACVVLCCTAARGQTPTDGIMMPAGRICIAATYMHDSWDQYWEGTLLRSNDNVGTLSRQTFAPMIDLGILPNLNVLASVAYVSAQPSAGQLAGVHGVQDGALWVKYLAVEQSVSSVTLRLFATGGFSIPIGNYSADYPYALGLGCTNASVRGILDVEHTSGAYLRAQAGYNERGIATLARDYYFTTQQYYTNQVNIPEAMDYAVGAGYRTADRALIAEATLDGMHTNGGFDMRRQDGPFPSNQMNFTRIGAMGQYFPPQAYGFGAMFSFAHVLSGRNVGQSTVIGGGIAYQRAVWNAAH